MRCHYLVAATLFLSSISLAAPPTLTQLSQNDTSIFGSTVFGTSFAPQASKLHFVTQRNVNGLNPQEKQIRPYLVDLQSGELTVLPKPSQGFYGILLAAHISGNGKKLVYRDVLDFTSKEFDIIMLDIANNNALKILDGDDYEIERMHVSADGNHVFVETNSIPLGVVSDSERLTSVLRVSADGSNVDWVFVPYNLGLTDVRGIKLSPSGSHLGLISGRGDNLYIYNIATQQLEQITDDSVGEVDDYVISGNKISYGDDRGLHIAELNGSNEKTLYAYNAQYQTVFGASISMSASGHMVSAMLGGLDFSAMKSNYKHVLLDTSDGSEIFSLPHILDYSQTGNQANLVHMGLTPWMFSQDEKRVYFIADINPHGTNADSSLELFELALDGVSAATGILPYITQSSAKTPVPEPGSSNQSPIPSPSNANSATGSTAGASLSPVFLLIIFGILLLRLRCVG